MKKTFGIRSDLLLAIVNEANGNMNKANCDFIESIYNLCLDSMLKEFAILKMEELEQEIISIEWKSANGLFHELEEIYGYCEGLHMKVGDFSDDLIENIFFLAFTEGFKTMQRIAEGTQQHI